MYIMYQYDSQSSRHQVYQLIGRARDRQKL